MIMADIKKRSAAARPEGQLGRGPGVELDSGPAWSCAWFFAFGALYKLYFRWRVFNPERVPLEGPVILASNHASFLDPPLVGAGVKRSINYLARENLFRFPVVGWVLHQWPSRAGGSRGRRSRGLEAILDRLLAGGAIILFPEGTGHAMAKLQPAARASA